MTKGRARPVTSLISPRQRFANVAVGLTFFVVIAIAGAAWAVPVEVVQQWAFNRAGQDTYAQFEAVGGAEFSLWALRLVSSILPIAIGFLWWNFSAFQIWFADAVCGLVKLTSRSSPPLAQRTIDRIRTFGCRVFLICWMVLFLAQVAIAFGQCRREWPYFRFNSGEVVLPNISETNRAVIRYLETATPPDARILVASDQKLFFLSYYLRPRVLLHRMHPDSEHVIPLKDQERKLNAYQLNDLTDADLRQMPHDFTLEYFEHPDLVDRSQILSDPQWISFIRQRERNPSYSPNYVVRLRSVEEGRP